MAGRVALLLFAACGAPPESTVPADATHAEAHMVLTPFADQTFRLRQRVPGSGSAQDHYGQAR
jgi:hypothetical protein